MISAYPSRFDMRNHASTYILWQRFLARCEPIGDKGVRNDINLGYWHFRTKNCVLATSIIEYDDHASCAKRETRYPVCDTHIAASTFRNAPIRSLLVSILAA